MALSAFLTRIVEWLRAGYPQGVPDADYIPLLALLARRLSREEVQQVAAALVQQGALPADKADAGVIITKLTDEMPLESDLTRVRTHLLAGGWPVDEAWPGADSPS
ncbi:DUF3349 domain-containing protein [Nocardia terpenica]|uniref:DUF3349 domain-containing protein n=1 Tax=Nocardia terpenica TaxID=455432 RepID=A0A164M875_9NOCA|nr:DUF3349 domain-containing protein [Nocardia terpenica]ATL67578.1 DUF3349 domain-containing protein [Nocardia terpenica]KZM73132.1 hypothetical protein AWN90_30995 [Nocardia terpenica]MBF6064295.1 DUF3349 domain-containing protein [Nocardia terpenica]MBF6106628.1 DUF3349 domain-containing protein [Nocardia terpenica]MBF6113913.1 DUF3349 domain-containing protein [Nocardia terpenica]